MSNVKKRKLDAEACDLKKQLEDVAKHRDDVTKQRDDVTKQRDEVTKQKDEALEENRSLRHVMEEMRSKVECPVCLVVPREAPAMCPR